MAEDIPSVGAFAIVPSNDLKGAIPFWARLGFERVNAVDEYVIMLGSDGCEVHLIQAGADLWRVPEHNPFGVFIRTPRVAEVEARVQDLVIRPGGVLRHREWGMYEFAVNGPDGLLVRIGWPSRLMGEAA